ncbi:MAG: DNA topoisomerase IV [Flavobacteriaceae bacterium]|nr:DNA topoisomerase IV [Flavobacteriaceae bacterium]
MRKILALLLCPMFMGCYSTERNCANFKSGTFEFETLVGTEVMKTRFIRNDSIEIDYFNNKVDTFSVRWINDCDYVMKKLHPKNQAEKEPVQFRIISTTSDEYTFEYSFVIKKKNRKHVVKRGTARKISPAVVN